MWNKTNILKIFKKTLIIFSLIFFSFFSINYFSINVAIGCSYSWNLDITSALTNCLQDSDLVEAKSTKNLNIDEWFKEILINWTTKIATFLALGTIFAIALGSFMMVFSLWEEEKIKKWKDVVKWWIIWLLAVVSAGFVISVVVKLIYTIWG